MRLAALDAHDLWLWTERVARLPGEPAVELHVLAQCWELRAPGVEPFRIEWDRAER